eukprot:scaffold11533_cov54-Phaeocystis_antarctica.AAC.1
MVAAGLMVATTAAAVAVGTRSQRGVPSQVGLVNLIHPHLPCTGIRPGRSTTSPDRRSKTRDEAPQPRKKPGSLSSNRPPSCLPAPRRSHPTSPRPDRLSTSPRPHAQ